MKQNKYKVCLICNKKMKGDSLFCEKCKDEDIFVKIKAFKELRYFGTYGRPRRRKYYSKMFSKFNEEEED